MNKVLIISSLLFIFIGCSPTQEQITHQKDLEKQIADFLKEGEIIRKTQDEQASYYRTTYSDAVINWNSGEQTVPDSERWEITTIVMFNEKRSPKSQGSCDYSSKVGEATHDIGDIMLKTDYCSIAINSECKDLKNLTKHAELLKTSSTSDSLAIVGFTLKAGDKICIPLPGKGNEPGVNYFEVPVRKFNLNREKNAPK